MLVRLRIQQRVALQKAFGEYLGQRGGIRRGEDHVGPHVEAVLDERLHVHIVHRGQKGQQNKAHDGRADQQP